MALLVLIASIVGVGALFVLLVAMIRANPRSF
jgi:hypothetical protein